MHATFRRALLLAAFIPLASLAPSGDAAAQVLVYPLKVSLAGVSQEGSFPDLSIGKLKLGNKELINLAQGRAPSAPFPKSEILALLFDCENGVGVISVWDVELGTALAAVTEPIIFDDLVTPVISTKNGAVAGLVTAVEADLESVAGVSDYLDGGELSAVLTAKLADFEGSVCPLGLKGNLVGFVRARVAGADVEALIGKGKFSAGRPIDLVSF